MAFTVMLGAAHDRWQFVGYSRSQEAAKARVTGLRIVDVAAARLPMSAIRRQLFVKDVKVFLRDVSQWLQLLPLLALVLLYLYNFRAIDLNRIPYMSGVLKNAYAFLNLGLAGFVLATVAVRFVFPAVSAEGFAFWIIRVSPVSFRDFLWSKFWTGVVPILVLTEGLTITANELLGIDPFLKTVCAVGMVFMTFALVGPGGRPRRAVSALRRRREPGGRLLRRRRLHGPGGPLHHRDDRGPRLGVCRVSLPAGQPAATHDLRSRPSRDGVRRGLGDQRRDLANVDEVGGEGVGEDERSKGDLAISDFRFQIEDLKIARLQTSDLQVVEIHSEFRDLRTSGLGLTGRCKAATWHPLSEVALRAALLQSSLRSAPSPRPAGLAHDAQ